MVHGLDLVVDEGHLAPILVLEFQDDRLLVVLHQLAQQILDGVASVVHLGQFKHLDNTVDLVAYCLVRVCDLHFNLVIRRSVDGEHDDKLVLIEFLVCHNRNICLLFFIISCCLFGASILFY